MKYLLLILLIAALLWIASIALANRRKSPHDSGGSGGDSGGSSSSGCDSHDGGCGAGDGGGGD